MFGQQAFGGSVVLAPACLGLQVAAFLLGVPPCGGLLVTSASLGPPPERGRIREVWTLSLRWFFLDPPPERKRIREVGVASF